MFKHGIQYAIDSVINMLFSKVKFFICEIHLPTVSAIVMHLIDQLYKFRTTS